MNETLKGLAEASDWKIPENQIQEVISLFTGTMEDTRSVRQLDLGSAVPAILYKADE